MSSTPVSIEMEVTPEKGTSSTPFVQQSHRPQAPPPPPAKVDPTALGLSGLGICCLAVSFQKMKVVEGTIMLTPWTIFFGAFCQLWAALFDWLKGNEFGGIAFFTFGHFWLGVSLTWMFGNGMVDSKGPRDSKATAFAFMGFLIFCLYMNVAALTANKTLFTIFIFADGLVFCLVMVAFGVAVKGFEFAAGVFEFILALLAFYLAAANVINHQFGFVLLPIGKPFLAKRASH